MDEVILNAAVNAVCREEYGCAPEIIPNVAARVREASEVALRAVIPLIEAAAFERAAETAMEIGIAHKEGWERSDGSGSAPVIAASNAAYFIAKAIRSLTEKQNGA